MKAKKMLAVLIALALVMCFALTGCGQKSGNGKTITIAFIGNTTGDYAMYGVPVRNSVKMYFDQLNKAGGINGKQITLLEYDDKADGTESVNALNLAVDKGAVAVVGSVLTGATVALSDATYEINMPQITASATSPKVTLFDPEDPNSEVKTNVFRTCFLDPFQGEKAAEFAETKGFKTVAIFYENGSDYSEAIVDGFNSVADAKGLKVVATESFETGSVDYKAQMTNVAKANPDMVLMPIYYGEAGLAITQLRAAGYKGTVLGGDGFGSVKDYASAEDLKDVFYMSGYAPGTESVAQFEKDYEAEFKEAVPNMFAPLAWDASLLLAKAIEAAENSKAKYGTAEYKEAIIAALAANKGTEGITGSYTFNETNDPVKSVALMQLVDGEEIFAEFF